MHAYPTISATRQNRTNGILCTNYALLANDILDLMLRYFDGTGMCNLILNLFSTQVLLREFVISQTTHKVVDTHGFQAVLLHRPRYPGRHYPNDFH